MEERSARPATMRQGQFPVATISFNVAEGSSLGTKQHTLEISILIIILNFNQNKFSFRVLRKHINTIIPVSYTHLLTVFMRC